MSGNGKAEIELEVSIVNLTYLFRGLDAIRELKEFCDEHASSSPQLQSAYPVEEDLDPPEPSRARVGS